MAVNLFFKTRLYSEELNPNFSLRPLSFSAGFLQAERSNKRLAIAKYLINVLIIIP